MNLSAQDIITLLEKSKQSGQVVAWCELACEWMTAADKYIQRVKAEARREGMREGIELYAWWKDGVQYVGTCGRTLKEALNETIMVDNTR
jgi:hypothetical protein